MFDFEQYNVVGYVDLHSNGNASIEVLGYTDAFGNFTKLTASEAADMFPPKGVVFAHQFGMRNYDLKNCLVSIGVKENISVGIDRDSFIWDKDVDVYEYGTLISRIWDSFSDNGEANYNVLAKNNLLDLSEDKYITSNDRTYLIKGGSNERLIKYWLNVNLDLVKSETGRIFLVDTTMPQEDGVIDITNDDQLIEWFMNKIIRKNWSNLVKEGSFNNVESYLEEAFKVMNLDSNVLQSRIRRYRFLHLNYLYTEKELEKLSQVAWFQKLIEKSIEAYKESYLAHFDSECKEQIEEAQDQMRQEISAAEQRKEEFLEGIQELTKKAEDNYLLRVSELDSMIEEHKLDVEIAQEEIENKKKELEEIDALLEKASKRKSSIVEDFSIIKEVLGCSSSTRTEVVTVAQTLATQSSRSFELECIDLVENPMETYQAFKKNIENVFKNNNIPRSSVSTLGDTIAVYKTILLPNSSIVNAILYATKKCRYLSEYVSASWKSFEDLWNNGLAFIVEKCREDEEMIHYLVLQNINLSYLPNYMQPLVDMQMGLISKFPNTDFKFPENLRILCTASDDEVIPMSKRCLQYIGCIEKSGDMVKDYYGRIKPSDDMIGYLTSDILGLGAAVIKDVPNAYSSYLNE